MIYQVIVQPSAQAEMENAYLWIRRRSAARAARWFNRLADAIESLAENPERYPLAPESEAFNREIRQMLYGKRRGVYRVLYTIVEDTVSVLYIRHGARRFVEPDEG